MVVYDAELLRTALDVYHVIHPHMELKNALFLPYFVALSRALINLMFVCQMFPMMVQLDYTTEIEVFCMLIGRSLPIFTKTFSNSMQNDSISGVESSWTTM